MLARPVDRAWLSRGALEVAPDLLGLLLVRDDGRAGRIVEVEAYRGADDPASHAFRGPTPRNEVMFGPAGHVYVYLSYGLHHCAHVVCGPPGEAAAVLLRALEPVAGVEAMRAARLAGPKPAAALRDLDLCRGPGRLCQALGVDRRLDGADLLSPAGPLQLRDDGWRPAAVASGPRIGISVAVEQPWRFWVDGSRHVSRGPARAPGRGRAAPS